MRRRRPIRMLTMVATCLAGTAALTGCRPTHLAYVHNAVLGVDLGASPNEGQVKLAVGYDRKTFAIVPRKGDDQDAMSVTAASRVHVQGLSTNEFSHIVATGAPAVRLAEEPQNLGTLVDQLLGDEAGGDEGGGDDGSENEGGER